MFNKKYLYIISGIMITLVGFGLVISFMSSASADNISTTQTTQIERSDKPQTLPLPLPTIALAPNQDQLDREREERQNPPDPSLLQLPTPLPNPRGTPAIPSPLPTRIAYSPANEMVKYVDKNLGFSLEYPKNWNVYPPTDPEFDLNIGYSVKITNYDTSQWTKSHKVTNDEVSIRIYSRPYVDGSQTEDIEKWLQSRYHPETEFTFIQQNQRKGFKEWRWTITGGAFDYFNMPVSVILKEQRVFVITLQSANSKFESTQEEIVESFQIP